MTDAHVVDVGPRDSGFRDGRQWWPILEQRLDLAVFADDGFGRDRLADIAIRGPRLLGMVKSRQG